MTHYHPAPNIYDISVTLRRPRHIGIEVQYQNRQSALEKLVVVLPGFGSEPRFEPELDQSPVRSSKIQNIYVFQSPGDLQRLRSSESGHRRPCVFRSPTLHVRTPRQRIEPLFLSVEYPSWCMHVYSKSPVIQYISFCFYNCS